MGVGGAIYHRLTSRADAREGGLLMGEGVYTRRSGCCPPQTLCRCVKIKNQQRGGYEEVGVLKCVCVYVSVSVYVVFAKRRTLVGDIDECKKNENKLKK